MTGKLLIEVRSVYGVDKVYPHNETAKIFAAIAGTTTLTHATLCHAEALGYLIQTVPKPWTSPLANNLRTG